MVSVKSLPGTDYIVAEQFTRGMFILSHCRRVTELKYMWCLLLADNQYFGRACRAPHDTHYCSSFGNGTAA